MQQKTFGKIPSGARLERIRRSPQFRNGSFQNIQETRLLADNASYLSMLWKYFGKGIPEREPLHALPAIKTDLKKLPDDKNLMIWFGHSSYLLSIEGKKILVDPVFSERPSPVQFAGSKSYPGTRIYSPEDFPELDLIIITHDHYDHLDYRSILELNSKTKLFCTALGVGSHLEYWGVDKNKIREFDWWEGTDILPGISITCTPARHFSGRGFGRNKTLWASFVLRTNTFNLFIGGDSGYDSTFKTIGDKFGPFDLAILECGQYDLQWPDIHMMPEDTVQAGVDLRARLLLPVHWAKFTLGLHSWKDPIERAVKRADFLHTDITTPRIGEPVVIGEKPVIDPWWVK